MKFILDKFDTELKGSNRIELGLCKNSTSTIFIQNSKMVIRPVAELNMFSCSVS